MTRKLRFLPTKATFKLGDRIGMGTVGVVYRATSPDMDEPVAIKLLHPSVSNDEQIVDRFEREVTIMERLNHPNIVTHYGGGILDGQYFYAMQLLDHGSLKDLLSQEGRLQWQRVVVYADQIAAALQHAHNHGIIHRDLKPSNLFFTDEGMLVLGDFGIARDTHRADITADRITVGTYAYMSPEQICADRNISGKADLYSLGCVMYEMLTGQPPYMGANFAQIWEQHLHAAPRSMLQHGIECPEWLESLVVQLLAKDPNDRPFNARAVQGMLRQGLREESGIEINELAKQSPPLTPVAGHLEGQPRMWVLWTVLAAAAVVVTALALLPL